MSQSFTSSQQQEAAAEVVVVTGASRGLGLAIVRALFQQARTCNRPLHVVGVARTAVTVAPHETATPLDGSSTRYGPASHADDDSALHADDDSASHADDDSALHADDGSSFRMVVGDVTDADTVARVVECVRELAGNGRSRVRSIVHNAGALEPMGSLRDVDVGAVERLMQVNLFAVLRLTQKLLPLMLMDGSSPQTVARTIMVSSGASTKAYRGWGAYCMSKAALNMMTATLAVEEPRVFAVAVRPGVVDTEMQRVIREGGSASMDPAIHDYFLRAHAEGQLLSADQPAATIASLVLRDITDEQRATYNGAFVSWNDEALLRVLRLS